GQNVINPMAAIMAGQMMLDVMGETAAAQAVEKAGITVVSQKLKSMSAGKMGYSTTEVGDLVASLV
ncbi:MAG TPA: isocitrate/isopropylmalate family dehydrogenase, partial [Bacillota bacterium]|nr:isocitrate/isopropylmalate family dehydrogenase [Bacillota bacterium]